jgi:signal transduction histidine kinase
MTRRLVGSYVGMALIVLLALEIPLGLVAARGERDRLFAALERDAGVIGGLVEDELQFGAWTVHGDVDAHLTTFPFQPGSELAIVERQGRIVHPQDPDQLELLPSPLPGVAAALEGERTSGFSTGHDGQAGAHVTVPVASGGVVHGAVYLHTPVAPVDARIQRLWLALAGTGALVLLVTGLVGARVARWTVEPLRTLDDAVARFAAGDLDVRAPTDRGPPEERELAERFNRMAAQLSALLAAQRAFVGDASHQLRSPLAALRLELEDLQRHSDDSVAAGIERALRETRRMARLVTDLLALARAEAARPAPSVEDAQAVLRSRAQAWEPLAAEEQVAIVHRDGPPRPVVVVPDALAQIVDNLLDNAIEAAPPDTAVELWIERHADRVEVHVRDRGPGLTDEARARAFDRFWRAPEARPGAGTGLGLAIARQLARSAGGDVDLRPVPPTGTDAVVVLAPAAATDRGAGSTSTDTRIGATTTADPTRSPA